MNSTVDNEVDLVGNAYDIDEKINEKVQEFVSLIEKSSYFTIIIEGGDDYNVFEPLEVMCEDAPKIVDILPVNGRSVALGIFNKLKNTEYMQKVAFIVDQDTWVHTGKPSEYEHDRVICTTGYSIENDVFMDRRLSCLMKSLGVYEYFECNLDKYLKWYVLAIERVINDTVIEGDSLDIRPNEYFKQNKISELILLRQCEEFSNSRFQEIFNDFQIKLRGKNLLYLFDWAVNNRSEKKNSTLILEEGQQFKQKKMPSYNLKLIMEETPRTLRGDNLNRIFNSIHAIAMAQN